MRRKFFVAISCFVLFIITVYIFHESLLRSVATALIRDNMAETADAIVVLSGGSLDRGNEAANLYHCGFSKRLVCPGANKVCDLKILNMDITESAFTGMNLLRQGVPDSAITIIEKGTSTREEADVLLAFCREKNYTSILLITSLLHTRRAGSVFRDKFENSGIKITVHGVKSSRFDEQNWWKSEDGLIAMNNEWLKQLYYWIK
jgi:uncharacterized SAM-binding protein YcdF (DUF218 family)